MVTKTKEQEIFSVFFGNVVCCVEKTLNVIGGKW
jgi:DNA-binding HxlR family transcriptional regulator